MERAIGQRLDGRGKFIHQWAWYATSEGRRLRPETGRVFATYHRDWCPELGVIATATSHHPGW